MVKPINNFDDWAGICLVGIGKHAKTKIIPALEKSGRNIIGIVSRSSRHQDLGYKCFNNLDEALMVLPSSTLFVLTTPPECHFNQALNILNSNFDVMIEKPALLCDRNFCCLRDIAQKKHLLLIEMLMYLENQTVQNLREIVRSNINQIKDIKSEFLIPGIPKNTFRDEISLERSLLSDMGCYPLSFMAYCGIPIDKISASRPSPKKTSDPYFKLSGRVNDIKLDFIIGYSKEYKNFVEINFEHKSSIKYEPFFYGMPAKKILTIKKPMGTKEKVQIDSNSFELMFKKRRHEWFEIENERLEMMSSVVKAFTRFKSKINF